MNRARHTFNPLRLQSARLFAEHELRDHRQRQLEHEATTNVAAPGASPSPPRRRSPRRSRPQKLKDQMAQRGEQDNAAPVLRVVEPREVRDDQRLDGEC